MGRALGDHDGGIGGLCWLIAQHAEAVEFDLIALGLRLRWLGVPGRSFNWRDLRAIVALSPPDSALRRVTEGEGWTRTDHLLALVVDHLAVANWQRQRKKGSTRPKPLKRPGMKGDRKVGADPIPISSFSNWWEGAEGE